MSRFEVEYERAAEKDRHSLDRAIRKKLEPAIADLEERGLSASNTGPLSGYPLHRKVFAGVYRIVFDVHAQDVRVLIVAHRREVYRILKQRFGR